MKRMTVRQLVHHLSRIKHATRCSALRAAATGGSESEEHLEKKRKASPVHVDVTDKKRPVERCR